MARQAAIPGFPFGGFIAESGAREAMSGTVLVVESSAAAPPNGANRPRLIMREPIPTDAPRGTLAATLLARTYQVWRDNPITRRRDILAKFFGA